MQLSSQVKPVIGVLSYLINKETLVNATERTKLNFTKFSAINKNKSYVPITGKVFEHITTTKDLSNLEKLYYLLSNSLAFINSQNNKQRSASLASKTWAKLLDCSRAQVFTMQKSLEKKGYLVITKDKNIYKQNKRNLLTPTLPNMVFRSLCENPDRIGRERLEYTRSHKSKLDYLDRTKLFIPLNYDLLKIITSSRDLSPLQKVIWLGFYSQCYKYYIYSKKTFGFASITSYEELIERYGCSRASLSKVMNILANNNFITKTRFFRKKDHELEDRQDKSLWQITLSLPTTYNLELMKIQDRAGISIKSDTSEVFDNNEDLTSNEASTDIDMDSLANTDSTIIVNKNHVDKTLELSDLQDSISRADPQISKSIPLLSKDLKLKIKNIKSNLEAAPKVLFNEFLKRFRKNDWNDNEQKQKKEKEFNICSQLIRKKLKELPCDKADKARKFAYSLVSKKLATGYAASLSKHELAKQLIHHSATWKPTKLGSISRKKEIDTALSVAWKAIVGGTWRIPLELAKAEVLQYEFRHYKRKYQESGVLSHEVKSLEFDVSNLLGGCSNLETRITAGSKVDDGNDKLINTIGKESGGTQTYKNEPLALGLAEGLEFNALDLIVNSISKQMLLSKDSQL